jgi:integrase
VARTPFPWFWQERSGWYVNKDGQRHFLGNHPPDFPLPRKHKGRWNVPPAIQQAFHVLMSIPQATFTKTVPTMAGPVVVEILDKFLGWCQKHRAPRTYEWYHDHIQSFLDSLADPAAMVVTELKPFHVIEWADKHPGWSPAYRRGSLVAVQRPFNWAEELGYITVSPIKKIQKPHPQRRDNPITPEEFAMIMGRYSQGDPFRDLLEFAWYSGCRPQEARHIEPRHVHLDAECIVIPQDEAKGRRRARMILLHGRALEIIKQLQASRTEVKLFLNEDGKPWERFAIANRFERLHLALGIQALEEQGITIPPLPRFNRFNYGDRAQLLSARKEHKAKLRERRKQILALARQHGKKFALVDARHGFCQRMLESGANHLAVAELLGHSTGRMVAETYSHMHRATAHLKEMLKNASGQDAPAQ